MSQFLLVICTGDVLLSFAINHMTFPNASFAELLDLAHDNDCVGVEIRNDLKADCFTGLSAAAAKNLAQSKELRLLGLAQLNEFNNISQNKINEVKQLINTAQASGTESVCLIPRNDGHACDTSERTDKLREALLELKPLFEDAGITGMVEPLGFASSSLRSKQEAVEAIDAVAGTHCFKLVHDTFHHFVAGGGPLFPVHTGIVHISGVSDLAVAANEMTDEHRGLVSSDDRLGNIEQLKMLIEAGYEGPVSMEAFSPDVHAANDSGKKLSDTFKYITSAVKRSATA